MSLQVCRRYETVLLYFIVTWMMVSSDVYKSVMWTTNNPIFQNSNTSKLQSSCFGGTPAMKVHLQSILPIVCPFEFIIMQTMPSQPSTRVLYENIWIVYDKESFDNCDVNLTARFGTPQDIANGKGLRNKKLYDCSAPETLKRYMYSIDFKEKSPVSPGIYFDAGKTYYFLATSDGTSDSLNNTKDGHCNNDGNNEIRMKFQVYVCKINDTLCQDTTIGEFTCLRPKPSPSVPTSSSVLSSISSTPSSSTTSESSVCVCHTSMSTLPSSSSVVAAELITITTTTTTAVTTTTIIAATAASTTTAATTTAAAATTTAATTEKPTAELCICPTLNTAKPNKSQRTGSDAELHKSRDRWMICAILFVIAFCFVLIILIFACYRLRKASMLCSFNDINKIECRTTPESEKSPPYVSVKDKNGLIPHGCDNTGYEVDGSKTPPDKGVEMTPVRTDTTPPLHDSKFPAEVPYDIIKFTRRTTSDYFVIKRPIPAMTAVTFCFWSKTTGGSDSVISYAVPSEANEIVFWDTNSFAFWIGSSEWQSTVSANDGQWHHICATWENTAGRAVIYKDGVKSAQSTINKGHVIKGGGTLIIGQEQDSVGGSFDATQCYIGDLTGINMWNRVLGLNEITAMSRDCGIVQPGNVLTWNDVISGTKYGQAQIIKSHCKS